MFEVFQMCSFFVIVSWLFGYRYMFNDFCMKKWVLLVAIVIPVALECAKTPQEKKALRQKKASLRRAGAPALARPVGGSPLVQPFVDDLLLSEMIKEGLCPVVGKGGSVPVCVLEAIEEIVLTLLRFNKGLLLRDWAISVCKALKRSDPLVKIENLEFAIEIMCSNHPAKLRVDEVKKSLDCKASLITPENCLLELEKSCIAVPLEILFERQGLGHDLSILIGTFFSLVKDDEYIKMLCGRSCEILAFFLSRIDSTRSTGEEPESDEELIALFGGCAIGKESLDSGWYCGADGSSRPQAPVDDESAGSGTEGAVPESFSSCRKFGTFCGAGGPGLQPAAKSSKKRSGLEPERVSFDFGSRRRGAGAGLPFGEPSVFGVPSSGLPVSSESLKRRRKDE